MRRKTVQRDPVRLDLALQRQLHSEWCWAAVTASVDRFFNPASTLEQCRVVSREFHQACCGGFGPERFKICNIPGALDAPLRRLGWLEAGPNEGVMSFDSIRNEIDGGRPIGVRVEWRSDAGSVGAHFIMITGYRVTPGGVEFLHLSDPLFPASQMTYRSFCDTKGGYHDGQGIWSHHYLLRATRGKS